MFNLFCAVRSCLFDHIRLRFHEIRRTPSTAFDVRRKRKLLESITVNRIPHDSFEYLSHTRTIQSARLFRRFLFSARLLNDSSISLPTSSDACPQVENWPSEFNSVTEPISIFSTVQATVAGAGKDQTARCRRLSRGLVGYEPRVGSLGLENALRKWSVASGRTFIGTAWRSVRRRSVGQSVSLCGRAVLIEPFSTPSSHYVALCLR